MVVQDPVANGEVEESKEVFPEHESKEEQEELDNTNEKLFLETQTYKNLEKALPNKIEIWDKKAPIETGKKILDRISSNKVAYESKSQRLETAFFEHGKDFFPGLKLKSVKQAPAADREIYMQKLAIIEACFGGLINLKPDHRKELANLLLPLASKSKTNIKETEKKELEEGEKMSEWELAFTKSPAFPVLTRLVEERLISHVDFEEIKQYYIENQSFTWINLKDHSVTVQKHLDSVFNNGPENQKKKTSIYDDRGAALPRLTQPFSKFHT